MVAMKKGADALKGIHSSLYVHPFPVNIQWTKLILSKVEKVDQTMDSIREQMDLTNEISDAISNPVGMGNMVDEVGLILLMRSWPIACTGTDNRTSSRPNSRRWSRKNWTTDSPEQTEYRYTHRHLLLESRTVASVSWVIFYGQSAQ
jgi:hypothetical protein